MSEFAYGMIAGVAFGSFLTVIIMSCMRVASDADERMEIDEWDVREKWSPPTTPPPAPRKK